MQAKYMVYSNSIGEMVLAKFYYKNHKYVWNDFDCVYYDETSGDESFLMDVPSDVYFMRQ